VKSKLRSAPEWPHIAPLIIVSAFVVVVRGRGSYGLRCRALCGGLVKVVVSHNSLRGSSA
jgi:hypothetical protein